MIIRWWGWPVVKITPRSYGMAPPSRRSPQRGSSIVTYNVYPAEGEPIVYQARINVSTRTRDLVGQASRRHRAEVKSRWRKLSEVQCAVIVLAVLRHDQRPDDLAARYRVSGQSVRRWVGQVIETLARQAPRLDR